MKKKFTLIHFSAFIGITTIKVCRDESSITIQSKTSTTDIPGVKKPL